MEYIRHDGAASWGQEGKDEGDLKVWKAYRFVMKYHGQARIIMSSSAVLFSTKVFCFLY